VPDPTTDAVRCGGVVLLVVNPLPAVRTDACAGAREAAASPLYLAGKALNALSADRVEAR